jgi:hypothetical protein
MSFLKLLISNGPFAAVATELQKAAIKLAPAASIVNSVASGATALVTAPFVTAALPNGWLVTAALVINCVKEAVHAVRDLADNGKLDNSIDTPAPKV